MDATPYPVDAGPVRRHRAGVYRVRCTQAITWIPDEERLSGDLNNSHYAGATPSADVSSGGSAGATEGVTVPGATDTCR